MWSGRPREPGKTLKKVGGEAPHIFEGLPGPPGPARPAKHTSKKTARLPSGTQRNLRPWLLVRGNVLGNLSVSCIQSCQAVKLPGSVERRSSGVRPGRHFASIRPRSRFLSTGNSTGCLKAVWPDFGGCLFEVWPAPGGAREGLRKCGGLRPPHFRRLSGAPVAGQTSKTHPQEPSQTASRYPAPSMGKAHYR